MLTDPGKTLTVLRAGPQDLVQDAGRRGVQRQGVPPSGVFDADAHAVALVLAGAPPGAAVIEFVQASGTYTLTAPHPIRIAIAGAPGPVDIGGRRFDSNRSFTLAPGESLRAGPRTAGQRGYIAVAGGLALDPVLGSRATHLRGGFGGLEGRALAAGDTLPLGPTPHPTGPERLIPDTAWPPRPGANPLLLRVLPGPQDDHFTQAERDRFHAATYTITAEADRMGYRLDGPRIAHAEGFNIVSDAIATGSVQIPGNGLPIVLLVDRQTTGGFPKIATVISADIPLLAQLGPGDRLRFTPVTRDEAEAAARARARWRAALPAALAPCVLDPAEMTPDYLLSRNLIEAFRPDP